ncbi:MAG TPA: hypothetical protein VGG57_00320 [Stellaceae bacterium]
MTYLFDAGDATLVIGFLIYGVYSVLNASGAEIMSGPLGNQAAYGMAPIRSVFQFALAGSPSPFTLASFAKRIVQHAVFYCCLLAVALTATLFFAAPLQMTGFILVCIFLGAGIGSLAASSGARLSRVLQGGIAVSYAAGAGMLFKIIALLWH